MNWTMKHKKKLAPLALCLFLLGLIAAIFGMNLQGTIGIIIQVIGNAAFLAGLFLFGMIWFATKRSLEENENHK